MSDEPSTPTRSDRAESKASLPLGVRIALTVLVAFLAAATVAGVWLGSRLTRLAEDELESAIESDGAMLGPVVRTALLAGDREALAEIAKGAARRGLVRLTVILPDGTVIAESEHSLPMPSHLERPEVERALESGQGRVERISTTTGESYVYVAWRIDGPDGRPVGVLRLARPMRAVNAVDHELVRILLFAALLGLPIAAVVGWLAARRIAAPLEEMTAAAHRMAEGDFERLPRATKRDEAGRLAEALGSMGRQISGMLRHREEQRAELEAILASMAEGVLAVDPDARVLIANRAVVDCLGLAGVPRPGTPLQEIVRLPEITAQLRRALRGERAPELDVVLPGAAGRVLGVSAAPIDGATGAHGAVLVLRDVTVIRRLERTRLDFVANVSHELRTPLAAVLGALETVNDLGEEDPDSRARMLDTATRHGRRLADIVDDLLALSQIESEGDRLERGPVPLLRTLRAAASAVAGDAAARGVTVTLPPAELGDVRVIGHEGRLEQVWTNLLANAVKYNRVGGSVAVDVAIDTASRTAEIVVRDTGQGIAAEHLPRIFERFYRVDKGRSRDQGGTGLGLAIVKHIVLAHRGSVDVESTPGVGSAFRVRLALANGVGPPAER